MTGAVRYLRPRRDDPHKGRNLRCRKCGDLVCVYEIPKPYINPHTFTCGFCLTEATLKEVPVPFHQQHRKDAA